MRGASHPPRLKTPRIFSLCITIAGKEPKLQKTTMMSTNITMKVHVTCPLSMHQFIEISICALEFFFFKHFDVERPMKVCAPMGLSRAPLPKLVSGELSLPAPYEKKTNSGAFPMKHQPCPSCTDVQVDVSMRKRT